MILDIGGFPDEAGSPSYAAPVLQIKSVAGQASSLRLSWMPSTSPFRVTVEVALHGPMPRVH